MRKKKPLKYTTDQLGRYHVEAFNEKGEKVDEAWADEFYRRGAYYDVMSKLKPHYTWDATRVKNL